MFKRKVLIIANVNVKPNNNHNVEALAFRVILSICFLFTFLITLGFFYVACQCLNI